MRRKINLWNRPKAESTEKEAPTTFTPKRMNLPKYKVYGEPQDQEEEIEAEESDEEESDEQNQPLQDGEELLKVLRKKKKGHPKGSKKRRSYNLSVCVSEEEEMLLRASASVAELGFSEWARRAMFAYAKLKPPQR